MNIMTSKPLALNILQTLFADRAPVKAFEGVGTGGYLRNCQEIAA